MHKHTHKKYLTFILASRYVSVMSAHMIRYYTLIPFKTGSVETHWVNLEFGYLHNGNLPNVGC